VELKEIKDKKSWVTMGFPSDQCLNDTLLKEKKHKFDNMEEFAVKWPDVPGHPEMVTECKVTMARAIEGRCKPATNAEREGE
jgi:hypothetical protein